MASTNTAEAAPTPRPHNRQERDEEPLKVGFSNILKPISGTRTRKLASIRILRTVNNIIVWGWCSITPRICNDASASRLKPIDGSWRADEICISGQEGVAISIRGPSCAARNQHRRTRWAPNITMANYYDGARFRRSEFRISLIRAPPRVALRFQSVTQIIHAN